MTPRSLLRRTLAGAAVAILAIPLVTVETALAEPPEVQVTLSSPTVSSGGTVTVTETVTNVHPFTILGAHARLFSLPDALPSYTTLVGCTGASGPCSTVADPGGAGYQAPVDSLSGGEVATVVFTLAISPTAPGGQQIMRGQLFGSNYATPIMDGPALTILTEADVAVALTARPRLGLLVPYLEFTVRATNNGPATLQNATVTTALPSGLSASSGDCAPGAGSVSCTFEDLPDGGSATARFTVPLRLLSIGIPYTFTATRTASSPQDRNGANDSAAVRCTVVTPLLVSCQ